MADIVVDLESNSEDLVNQGIKAFNLGDFNTAVVALSKAVELLVAEHGDKHDALGVAYFYYGKALLEVYREEVEPLGDAVPRELDSDSGEDPIVETDSNKKKSEVDENCSTNEATVIAGKPLEKDSNITQSGNNKNDCATVTNGATEQASSSGLQDTNEEAAEEEASDLQVAWEVLEMAKIIFNERGDSGKKELAETFILLGEISLESENFASAIDDIKHGLEMQKAIVEEDSRTLAQSYYKLAVALSTNNQIDEAIEHFKISLNILKNKVGKLMDNAEANKDEIEEIKGLIPEIEEKIADMKSFKEEAAKHLMEAMQSKPASNGPFDASSSTTAVNDISHLIKRKRKTDEEDDSGKSIKRVSE